MVDQVEMHGRVVLITAAARGLGREVAGQLARCGATVIVSARDAHAARRCAGAPRNWLLPGMCGPCRSASTSPATRASITPRRPWAATPAAWTS